MPKRKLFKYESLGSFPNVFQPGLLAKTENFFLKNNWKNQFFKNDNPIVAELGCGRAEYSVELASRFKNKNFIAIDIKGDRLWMGAKKALDKNILNVCFLRAQIEQIEQFFANKEISELWITFPDPQPNKAKKRLTSPLFLSKYANIVTENCIIHLKTDSQLLFDYTLEVINAYNHHLHFSTSDLYHSNCILEALNIQTYYENLFLNKNLPIFYLNFTLNSAFSHL